MILASSCGHLKFFLSILWWTLLVINEVHSSPVNLGQDTELWDEEPIQISAKVTRIGCLFAKEICDENSEWCFNDNAFGRCLPAFGLVNDEALYRYDLDKDQTKFLENQMEKLFVDGHRWRHAYTQCSLQNTLDNFKYGSNYEPKSCDGEKLEELEGALIALEDELDPLSLALIRFRPSEISEQPDWAEELYVPGLEPQEYAAESPIFQPKNDDDLRQAIQMAQTKNSQPKSKMTPDEEKFLEEALENLVNELEENDSQKNRKFKALKTANSAALMGNFDKKSDSRFFDLPSELEMEELEQVLEPKIFTGIYNSPDTFRHGLETRDVMNVLNSDKNGDENNQDNNFMMADQPIENSAEDLYNEDNDSIGDLISGEEGLAFLQKSETNEDDDTMGSDEARYLLQELVSPPSGLSARSLYGNGFERQERLDVKKPGPWFRNVNNYGNFDYEEPEILDASQSGTQEEVDLNPEFESAIEPAELLRFSLPQGEKEIEEDLKPQNKMVNSPDETKKPREKPQPEINSKAALLTAMKKSGQNINDVDIIESAYVHLVLNTEITEWMLARKIVEIVADQLNVERVYFTEIRFNKNIITFRVIQPNNMGINSSQISERIEKFNSAENILRGSDIKIVKAGVGKSPNVIWEYLARESFGFYNNGIFFWTFMASGLVAAVVLSGFGIYYIRKNAKSKDKFSRIATDDPTGEACKDYQELCRARMATKAQVGPSPVRSGSFKKEGDVTKSPNSSTRSSSSSNSWSEEPVQSHMDISTGHMVLAYMEDHLKKKDRLDQEWAALCGYEAEPNATTIAQKSENAKKNRYTNALPYDHSRVILNELANLNSADYINASTITDHDPRNPAYIATQGPLSNTVADFWQMVWEQGSVVIVALTRLAENGNQLCHRYWPEEGSELHHIYEVHLVSEHIWCDEYLVRSFYLKNLKTAETRTVTQFNFLAWPENGIPSNMKALLEFRRKVNKSYRGRSCPIIVHCSDGAGRSGTYCLIDMVLNRMSKGAKEIDIAASLEHIRDQRPGMVKTKQQFEFVLMSVAEEVHAILKALPQ